MADEAGFAGCASADGSMPPRLAEGDWLWVDPGEPAEPCAARMA